MKPGARRALFVVAYRARDLDGLALVAHHLERRHGLESVLTNGYEIERKLLRQAPDVVVFDHLVWGFKAEQVRLAKSLGMRVVVLPTEGLFQSPEEPRQRAGKLQGVSRLVDCQLTWGELARSAILEEDLAAAENVHTVGCPRFDFYRDPYLPLMGTRDEFLATLRIERRGGPILLWATNTHYLARNQKLILRRQTRQGKLPEAEVRAMLEDHQVQFREHSRLVLDLARRHPDWNIVIKIHPAEWIDPYLELERRSANIRLAFDAPIFKFLYHCDVLLQRGCTTATEAWMLQKPVLELQMGRYTTPIREDFVAGNRVVATLEETEEAIARYLAGQPISDAERKAREVFVRTFYDRVDGRASERSADLIAAVAAPPGYTDADGEATRRAAAQAWDLRRREEDARWINRFKDLLGVNRETSLRLWKRLLSREGPGNQGLFLPEAEITAEMVERLRRDYDRVLGTAAA